MKEIDNQTVIILMFLKMRKYTKISLNLSFRNIHYDRNFFKEIVENDPFAMIYASDRCFEKDVEDFQKFLMYSEFIHIINNNLIFIDLIFN